MRGIHPGSPVPSVGALPAVTTSRPFRSLRSVRTGVRVVGRFVV